MKTVFISYSSTDRTFAEKLSDDLKEMGIGIWFDQWEIKVGDSLIEKISSGIEENNFLAIILSPASVESDWVKKELRTALYREIEQHSVFVLPVLYKDCQIPLFLKEKKYADFRENYDSGLKQILNAVLEDMFELDKSLDRQLADFHIKTAMKYEENGDVTQATLSYEKALTVYPDYDETYLHFGVLHANNGNLQEAKLYFNKALGINPRNINVLINLGGLSIGLSEWESAISCFRKVLDSGESGYIIYRQLGQALIEKNCFDEAIENLRKAIELSPSINEYIFTCYLLYQAYGSIESYESYGYALAYLEEFATKLEHTGQDNIDLFLDISEKFLIANMPDEADEFLKKAMAFDISHSKVKELSMKLSNFKKSLKSMGIKRIVNATKVNYESAKKNIIRSLNNMDGVYLVTSPETGGSPIPKKIRKKWFN